MELLPVLTLVAVVVTLAVVLLRRTAPLQDRMDRMERGFTDALRSTAAELARGEADAIARIRQEVSENFLKGLDGISQRIEEKLLEIRGEMARELSETADRNLKGFDQVASHLKDLGHATGQMVLLSRDIGQLNVLLTQPKARGAFGELTLQQMRSDLFGSHTEMFDLQYQMEWGERADAAIFVRPDRSQFVCVDAKFPMANALPLGVGLFPPSPQPCAARAAPAAPGNPDFPEQLLRLSAGARVRVPRIQDRAEDPGDPGPSGKGGKGFRAVRRQLPYFRPPPGQCPVEVHGVGEGYREI
jgi:hypothetical protein